MSMNPPQTAPAYEFPTITPSIARVTHSASVIVNGDQAILNYPIDNWGPARAILEINSRERAPNLVHFTVPTGTALSAAAVRTIEDDGYRPSGTLHANQVVDEGAHTGVLWRPNRQGIYRVDLRDRSVRRWFGEALGREFALRYVDGFTLGFLDNVIHPASDSTWIPWQYTVTVLEACTRQMPDDMDLVINLSGTPRTAEGDLWTAHLATLGKIRWVAFEQPLHRNIRTRRDWLLESLHAYRSLLEYCDIAMMPVDTDARLLAAWGMMVRDSVRDNLCLATDFTKPMQEHELWPMILGDPTGDITDNYPTWSRNFERGVLTVDWQAETVSVEK